MGGEYHKKANTKFDGDGNPLGRKAGIGVKPVVSRAKICGLDLLGPFTFGGEIEGEIRDMKLFEFSSSD